MSHKKGAIGIFDSGYGGLSVFKEIKKLLPEYDYIYLGDNARVPYGTRSFDTVYEFTRQCVFKLFDLGCNLVILACNTASAKALKNIQKKDLPPGKKVLGVIRPTTEIIHTFTQSNKIGILATQGTVKSESYLMEIAKFHPHIDVYQHACPLWVPIVEYGEQDSPGTSYFVKRDIERLLSKDKDIDTILLACTHYPLLMNVLKKHIPEHINIVSQGPLVASSLQDYLSRHTEIDNLCLKNGKTDFYTTDNPSEFNKQGKIFFKQNVFSQHIEVI
ncbi:MAG TPA: glutamate racemase [Sphingobacterium sp.]|nr:glutamate racemase [Sphingobacterium sp.]